MSKICPECQKSFTGHPNKKFCCQRCKDRWHNAINPRGFQAHLEPRKTSEEFLMDEYYEPEGWEGHKSWFSTK